MQENGFIMSHLTEFKQTEEQTEELITDNDTEVNSEVEEMTNSKSFTEYVDGIILCPDSNFQCKEGKKLHFSFLCHLYGYFVTIVD